MDYTRLTIHGTSRRGDLVVPSDEPLIELMPYLLDVLEEDPGKAHVRALTTVDGEQLATHRSLAEQGILDGTLLDLVPIDEAPPAPEISDVTEAVVTERERRGDVYGQTWARRLVLLTVSVLGFLAVIQLLQPYANEVAWALGAGAITLAVISRWRPNWPAKAASATAIGGAVAAGGWFATQYIPLAANDVLIVGGLGAICGGALVSLVVAWGAKQQPMLLGSAAAVLSAGLPLGLRMWGLSPADSAVISVGLGTLAIGLLPGLALTLSGLTRLDDSIVDGVTTDRESAGRVAHDSFAVLGWIVVGMCVPLLFSLISVTALPGGWATTFALLVGIVLACRARFFPLVEPIGALWLCVAVLSYGMLAAKVDPQWQAPVLLGAAGALILIVALRPAAHVRARIRGWMNLIEQLAVIALIPVLLGYFGVFTDLLRTFQR